MVGIHCRETSNSNPSLIIIIEGASGVTVDGLLYMPVGRIKAKITKAIMPMESVPSRDFLWIGRLDYIKVHISHTIVLM